MKSNAMVKASYRLTPAEQRLIVCALSNVEPNTLTPDTVCIVHADDMAKLADTDRSAYDNGRLLKLARKLASREITFHELPHGEGDFDTCISGWVLRIKHKKSEGMNKSKIGVCFHPDVVPFLKDFSKDKGHFTKYLADHITGFKSIYGMRFYEMIANQRNIDRSRGIEVSELEFEIDWLRDTFGLQEKYREAKDFRKFVVKPALNDFGLEKCPIELSEVPHQRGAKRTSFVFTARDKYPIQPKARRSPTPSEWDKLLRQNAKVGESEQQARSRIQGLINKGEITLN